MSKLISLPEGLLALKVRPEKIPVVNAPFDDDESAAAILAMLDTSRMRSTFSMFRDCSNLTSVPLFDTGSVTNMSYMFRDCSNLTSVPLFDTGSVTNMSYMLYNTNLTTVPLFDTGSVTDMADMFYGCKALTTVPPFNTSSVQNMTYLFGSCSSLEEVPALDMSKVTSAASMFYGCTALKNIGCYGMTRTWSLSAATALGHDAIVTVLQNLGTAYNTSQTLTLGSAKLALLSANEKAIATNKGWKLA